MRVERRTSVLGKHGNELSAHDIAKDGGHEREPTGRLIGCQNGTNGLHNFSSGEGDERISHSSDEFIEIQ